MLIKENRKLKLTRIELSDKQTLGVLTIYDGNDFPFWECRTLELPWKDNKRRVSCIPVGVYNVKKRYSEKYKNHFHILDVPNRDFILIHPANYVSQLLGCVAVGDSHTDINGDGLRDVTSSKQTMRKLLSLLPNEFTIEIE